MVEGAGLHACEYMTNGVVVVLGGVSHNVGAGMTGGVLYLRNEHHHLVHPEYLRKERVLPDDETFRALVTRHVEATGSRLGRQILEDLPEGCRAFGRYAPH